MFPCRKHCNNNIYWNWIKKVLNHSKTHESSRSLTGPLLSCKFVFVVRDGYYYESPNFFWPLDVPWNIGCSSSSDGKNFLIKNRISKPAIIPPIKAHIPRVMKTFVLFLVSIRSSFSLPSYLKENMLSSSSFLLCCRIYALKLDSYSCSLSFHTYWCIAN